MLRLLEHLLIVGWLSRLQEEYLDERSRFFTEVQTSLNHFSIIVNHQRTLWQMAGQVVEDIFTYLSLLINE